MQNHKKPETHLQYLESKQNKTKQSKAKKNISASSLVQAIFLWQD